MARPGTVSATWADERQQGYGFDAGDDFAAFEAGHFVDVGEEARHANGVLLDAGEQVHADVRVQAVPGEAEGSGGAANAGQRCSEVVGEAVQKGGAEFLGFALGFGSRGGGGEADALDGGGGLVGEGREGLVVGAREVGRRA